MNTSRKIAAASYTRRQAENSIRLAYVAGARDVITLLGQRPPTDMEEHVLLRFLAEPDILRDQVNAILTLIATA